MADHEELEGENTPGASPRDEEKETIVENDVGEDKVKYQKGGIQFGLIAWIKVFRIHRFR